MLFKKIKRLIDVVVSILALAILTPVFIAISIIIAFTMGFPIVYLQQRSGYMGRVFTIYKFRSMRNLYDDQGNPLPDEDRITKFGWFLRRSKLDEILQLWNVLRGEMSLVGPRPTLPEQVDKYTNFQRQRLSVAPGMTGWAQVNGNTRLSWNDRIKHDIWYIQNWSIWLDFKILIKTIGVVLFGE